MSLSEQARELAEKIDKATPGPWEIDNDYELSGPVTITPEGRRSAVWVASIDWDNRGDCDDEGRSELADVDADAIIAARNEAPDLLSQLADENERLQRVTNIMADALIHGTNRGRALRLAVESLGEVPPRTQGGAMSITEAIEALKELVNCLRIDDTPGLDILGIFPEVEDALPVIESYVQEKEGQGGLGL